ncbi:MAG: FtsK/SpoIIIE domain-containing protein [Tepidisphaerales bacterium]
MTQSTSDTAPSTQPALAPGVTRRDLQRMALRDLVSLATECATMETQLERKLQMALEQAKKEFQTRNWDIDDRVKTLKEKIEVEYQQKLTQVDAQLEGHLRTVKAADEKARYGVELDLKNTQKELRKHYDQANWLAESVFEATTIQLGEELKAAGGAAVARNDEINDLSGQGTRLMVLYGQVPPPEVEPPPETPAPPEPLPAYNQKRDEAKAAIQFLAKLSLPRMFVGARPIFYVILIVGLVGGITHLLAGNPSELHIKPVTIAAGVAAILCVIVGVTLKFVGISQLKKAWVPVCQLLEEARRLSAAELERAKDENQRKLNEGEEKRKAEEKLANERYTPMVNAARQKRDEIIGAIAADYNQRVPQLQAAHKQARAEIDEWRKAAHVELKDRYLRDQQSFRERSQKQQDDANKAYYDSWSALERRLSEGIVKIQAPIEEKSDQVERLWDDPLWAHWIPPKTFASTLRLGHLTVDLRKIADAVPRKGELKLKLPEPFTMTASLGFPRQASLLIQTDRDGREEGLRILQMVMARLLTTLPAGRVRFTIIDPVGLGQNFAGFMHLADHDDALIGGRIWTETEQIQQRLADLTEHMETVIQKYLRNEYETIDEYNDQAGELAEPYRFLVIADFPTSCEVEACKRLSSIASSGARCGVYTLVLQDIRQSLPSEMRLEELESHSVVLKYQDGKYIWKDETFSQFPLDIDPPPTEDWLTRTMDIVGRYAKEAKRVEVSFDTIAPHKDEFWTRKTNEEVVVPIGRMGATRLQYMKLGKGVAQHMIIAGKTGSGKSTLLHAIITNLAMWYRPDEVEFYLVDFKKGVEFKTYATHALPHARAIAVESDREFGLSVLQRLDAELTKRGNLYRKIGVQDINSYRQETGERMPRILLIIDEYQEFFTEDDKLAQDAALLLDRLVRQGRAFGVHVVLGSQTIGGSSGLSRATLGQMAVRVALQTSEADSQLILGDGNSAARLLSRPGEAIYNDAGGLVENNSPFQVAWLDDDRKEHYLDAVQDLTIRNKIVFEEPIVFEGNAPADIRKNKPLAALIQSPAYPPAGTATMAWAGDPVAIKDPTAVIMRRQAGINVLLIGQQDEAATAIMVSMILSLATQHAPGSATVHILDGNPADSPHFGVLHKYAAELPLDAKNIDYRAVDECMAGLAAEMDRRRTDDAGAVHQAAAQYVFIAGLQRYRLLRKGEDDFSFSASDEEKKPQASKLFADLLKDGPAFGIHFVVWVDTPASLERTLERGSLREFDNRILFQMSANDSSNLIDSPAANKLGFNRALSFSEEQGVLEKFRPYSLPDREWFAQLVAALNKKSGK